MRARQRTAGKLTMIAASDTVTASASSRAGRRRTVRQGGFRGQGGFSLIEVIAAIMLLGIAFAALMKVAGASINLTHNAAEHSEAAMRARSLLDSAFIGETVQPGSSAGRFDRTFRWQLDVTPWMGAGSTSPDAPLHLYQLDLDVLWGATAHPRSAHFRTLRLGGSLTGAANAGAAAAVP